MAGRYSEMIQENSTWYDKPEVQKGDRGEKIVQNILERLGYICYKSVSNKSHPYDFEARKNNIKFYVEVKTKPRRRKYPDTGFNYRHYQIYKRVCEEDNIRMFICFVDIVQKMVYGNYLDVLDKDYVDNNCLYPFNESTKQGELIRYFPLSVMKPIKNLSEEEIKFLEKTA